jgi:prepilin-type N-terminal cleavage/methylation domain-containing protein
MFKRIKGFTLSEILIAITIIGIIAAVTLPMITYQYKKAFIENKYKKAYSTLANAINMSVSQNGHPEQWGLGDDNDAWAKQYLLPYIKIDNYCGKTQTGICKFAAGTHNDYKKKFTQDIGAKYSRFHMADGVQVAFLIDKNASHEGVIFYVDIDGYNNGSNKYGKDVFILNIYTAVHNEGWRRLLKNAPSQLVLLPSGFGRTKEAITNPNTWEACVKGRRCHWCSYLIMQNGWKLPKDYPIE